MGLVINVLYFGMSWRRPGKIYGKGLYVKHFVEFTVSSSHNGPYISEEQIDLYGP